MSTISADEDARLIQELKEQHAEELSNIQERHVGELQKLHDIKNKALQEHRGMMSTFLVSLSDLGCFTLESSHVSLQL